MHSKIPSQKEIQNVLGSTLADAFFELSNPTVRTFVGVTPPLRGPDEQLWHSPSDQLIGKNCLKPPVPSKITQAVTHRGILELGEGVLKKFEADLEAKIRQSLRAEIKEIHLLIEAEQRHVTNLRIKKIEDAYDSRIDFLKKEYDKKLEEALNNVIKKYNKILQKAVVQTRMNITLEMMRRLRTEIEFVVTDLHADYERRCCIQRQNMIADFNEIIRNERAKVTEMLTKFQQRKNKDFECLRAKLENECTEVTERRVRCERLRCSEEKEKICKDYEKTVETVEKLLESANNKIEELEMKPPVVIPPNDDIWKRKIQHIIDEFQKFIQYVLHSTPNQTNFLLSRESALLFPFGSDHFAAVDDNKEVEEGDHTAEPPAEQLSSTRIDNILHLVSQHPDIRNSLL